MKLDTFTLAYIEAALWSSTDDDDEPMDKRRTVFDLPAETVEKMRLDCARFQSDNWDLIAADLETAGHDFWLTRNGHGAGFWDGDWPESDGEKLTKAAKAFGEFNLYVGDDGQVYA